MKLDPAIRLELCASDASAATLLAVGDFTLASPPGDTPVLDDNLHALLNGTDFCVANLECVLQANDSPAVKSGPHLAGSPATVQALKQSGFHAATMATNHIMDYGPEAMFATRALCENEGIRTVGVGRNLPEALDPVFFEVRGTRIAVFATAQEEFNCADDRRPGAARLDLPHLGQAIAKSKSHSDLIVVFAHAGSEYYPAPSPRTQETYRHLIDCGAHAVIAHHPHVVQGIEIYHDAPIVYSVGNFLLPSRLLPAHWRPPLCWYEGMAVRMEVAPGKVLAVECYPVRQGERDGAAHVELLRGSDCKSFADRLRRLCEIAADPVRVRELWKCHCADSAPSYLSQLSGSSAVARASKTYLLKAGIHRRAPHYFGVLLAQFLRPAARRPVRRTELATLCNLFRCPAHHESLVGILEMDLQSERPRDEAWAEYQQLMAPCRSS